MEGGSVYQLSQQRTEASYRDHHSRVGSNRFINNEKDAFILDNISKKTDSLCSLSSNFYGHYNHWSASLAGL